MLLLPTIYNGQENTVFINGILVSESKMTQN